MLSSMSKKSRQNAERQAKIRAWTPRGPISHDLAGAGPQLRALVAVETNWLVHQSALHDLERAIARARSENVSWTAIGNVLGISKQTARNRYGGLDA